MVHDSAVPKQFTIRVYGILLDAAKGILVADEQLDGIAFTKFPGGGLHFGEGPRECLVREWMEELGEPVEVTAHFYTTDFFQRSFFNPAVQVISIYYLVKLPENSRTLTTSGADLSFAEKRSDAALRWIAADVFDASILSFPIDRIVGTMIEELLRRTKQDRP